ncbi:MAG: LIC_10190 family membrane protein [Phycisphaerae bacterium]
MQALAILSILLTWAFLALVCVGLGAWLPRATNSDPDPADHLLAGLATLLALLQFWHFLGPINFITYAALLFLGVIVASAIIGKSTFRSPVHTPRWAALTFALLALWLANRATGPNAEYDAGLYHLQAIKWTETFRIVPGLANLHMRFGFSSTLTLFAAFLDHGPWQGNANHLTNGFFLVILAAMIVCSATRVFTSTAEIADRLLLFTAPLLTDWALDVQASSDSTDIGAAVLAILAACYFVRTFAEESRPLNALMTTLLAASAIAAKGSTLFLCAPMIAITLLLLKKQSAPSIFAAALILLLWTLRETILTGYPLYPFPALSLPVDWRMPLQKVEWLRHTLLNWARWFSYDDTQNNLQWLPTWFHHRLLPATNFFKCLLPATLGIVTLIIALARRRLPRPLAILLACIALAAVAWFFSAPDPRYSSQLFTLLMAAPLAALLPRRCTLIAAPLLALAPLCTPRPLWVPSASPNLFHPTPTAHTRPLTTPTGLTINIPVPKPGSDFEDRTWNAPLPAAPLSEIEDPYVPMPPLRLRRPPDLQEGFTRQPAAALTPPALPQASPRSHSPLRPPPAAPPRSATQK